ncbi:MAG: transcription antitermination factor NusB [Pseudomonadota bacterium]|jgi:N utilization substance protein B
MNGRRQARACALQALYAADVAGTGGTDALGRLWEGRLEGDDFPTTPVEPEDAAFAQTLVDGALSERDALDARIEKVSHHWRVARMPVVDRNILRLGAWELTHRADIPTSVTINEAIELAKVFGGADSRAFVNGVLDRLAGESGRGRKRR